MRTGKILLFVAAALVALGVLAIDRAQQIFVIANSNVHLTAGDVTDVYLGEKQFAGEVKLVPVDNGPLQDFFLDRVLNMNSVKYNGKWAKKSFREGLNPPPVKSGDAEVTEYVKRTPGSIGYVSSAPAGVTVIRKY